MKRIARIFFGLAGLGLLAATIMPFTEQHAVASQPMLVTVTNTPLPVQGTVSVGNTPSVNVANSPSVNVANTPTVNISNASIGVSNALDSSSKPVPLLVTSQGTPYQSECQIPSTTSSIGSCAFSPLNADTQLVVQEFDVGATTQPGTNLRNIYLQVDWKNQLLYHNFPISTVGTDSTGVTYQAVHQQTTVYADLSVSNTTPTCEVIGTSNAWTASCAISGYLVPAQ